MKKSLLLGPGLLVLWTLAIHAGEIAPDPDGAAMLQEACRAVFAYHAGQPAATNHLRVVYFVPKDGTPLGHYAERLDRVVTDVSAFYRDSFRRFGVPSDGLPLERINGKLVIHVVNGKWPASHYHYDSGDETAGEIRETLAGTVNMEREFLLVFYALCQQTNGGRYIFNAPYYGYGQPPRSGLCHAADCAWLDPLNLTDTNESIVYTEHYYGHLEQTVAKFNSWYLGGVAHELGHCLGLPHDAGGPDEQAYGVSLMGGGNLNYREDVWGGRQPAFLARASALKLLSLPLLTGSDRGRWTSVNPFCDALKFSWRHGVIHIAGSVTDAIPAYAVIAYVHGDKQDDHESSTSCSLIRNGQFTFDVNGIETNRWHRFEMILSVLYANGADASEGFPLTFGADGPDVAALNSEWLVDRAERAVMETWPQARDFVGDQVLRAAPTADGARKLRALRAVLEPAAPLDLRTVTSNTVFLSDVAWTEAKVGWGQVARNHFWFDPQIQNGVLIRLGGQFFDKGLYAHATARYVFPLGGQWKTFTAVIGLQDGAASQGSAVFTVRGDGKELFRSQLLRVGHRAEAKADLTGVKELELVTEGGEGHNHNSWAVWAEPKVER